MPHIHLTEGVPGILGPMLFRPERKAPQRACRDSAAAAEHAFTGRTRVDSDLRVCRKRLLGSTHFRQTQGASRYRRLGTTRRQTGSQRRYRQCVLHVQPLCGWPCHLGAAESGKLPGTGHHSGGGKISPNPDKYGRNENGQICPHRGTFGLYRCCGSGQINPSPLR
jgi:hypothetical protein